MPTTTTILHSMILILHPGVIRRDHEQGVENECDCFGGAQYAQEFHWHSAVAGSLGGFSAHTRNIVLDVFIAICQYPAQNMESYQCINDGNLNGNISVSLSVSITTPTTQAGTVGGGTQLPSQSV
ncbi:hypothetical protein HID58_095864 [Brassica napus]|uniref:Uncharacterized protein n=1 Tax=Brassica napus TaxID=3708 RepID=A0ABQ7X4G1_BRANA|nr:hypothetical protein HID58_095864 [Brassica napus]